VSVRDAEPYLDDALRSVAEQTHEELEVIVVDDGSPDAAADIARPPRREGDSSLPWALTTSPGRGGSSFSSPRSTPRLRARVRAATARARRLRRRRVTPVPVVGLKDVRLTLVLCALLLLASSATAARPPASVAVEHSRFGDILFDGRGYVLYAFTRDPRGKSVCSGACARAWPPYVVKSRLHAGAGVARNRLATTRRSDGSWQLTYAGRPLYYYVGDRRPGQILCQNVSEFGGVWRVVRASGRLVG
jgi:predicted lipoprotein with Yx(FWY)xxD motif